MKKCFSIILALFLTISFTNSFAQEKENIEKQAVENTDSLNIEKINEKSVSQEKLNTICPVSNEDADPEVTYVYNGKTYSLCCEKCLKKFKANPEKYISRMEKEKSSDEVESN